MDRWFKRRGWVRSGGQTKSDFDGNNSEVDEEEVRDGYIEKAENRAEDRDDEQENTEGVVAGNAM